jgi:hypothetical protein
MSLYLSLGYEKRKTAGASADSFSCERVNVGGRRLEVGGGLKKLEDGGGKVGGRK